MAQTRQGTIERTGREAERMAREAARNPWVERLARFGYAARGVVYAVIGLLALQAAFAGGRSGETTGAEGAIQKIAEQSRVLLVLVAIGLAGYALWRFVQAFLDPDHKGTEPKGLAKRAMALASGVGYSGLALLAARIASGSGGGGGGGAEGNQGLTADLLSKPFGRWLVILAGVAVIIAGLDELRRGFTKSFRDKLKMGEMSPEEQRLATHTGQVGLMSRGFVFLIIGWFLAQAGLRYDPSQASGLGGALDALAAQSYGPWLLALVAAGLLAYGAYSFLEARYRRINL